MNYSDLSSKLTQVIEQIPKDVFYDFCCSYAQEHEELAMALVNEFWRPEKDDYRSMVQQCLMHPTPAGVKNGDGFDWGAIAVDLSRMMNLADEKVKEGSLLDAAEIARYVMTLTCAEYESDHPYGETYGEVWWLRRKPLKEVLERARVMVTELLITGDGIDDDSQRGLMKEIVAECKPFKKSHICRIDDFLEDAQAKVLSPKRYLSWLQKKVDNTRGGHFRKPYLEKMVRFLDKMGKRDEAIAALEANKDKDDELRLLYVDMLTEWKMYDEALEVADNDNNIHASIYGYSKKTLAILDLMDDREKTIKVCKDRFCKSDRKQPYFDRLRQEMTKEEWDAFIDDTIRNADDVFQEDYNHVEAQIYMEHKMYDHLVKFCLHTLYRAEENLEKYAKYMSEADQRLVAQDIVERMKLRAPECKRGDDYDHFAGWIKRLYDSSPVCKKIAREVAEEIVQENPNKAFRRLFERIFDPAENCRE
jgi:hypothetical protein